jgi:PLP dependent protein
MTEVLADFNRVNAAIARAAKAGRQNTSLVAVTKTHSAEHIRPVLEAGHRTFGENRVQEAKTKWPALRQEFPGLELHLIGPLQSNKAAEAVQLFDVIQTVDREKIAAALAAEIKKQNKAPKLLVQVNTGREPQKAGIDPDDCAPFLARCSDEYGLKISGLMCIPPAHENPQPHFALLRELASKHHLPILSMGMSSDYELAIAEGATHVRVGSAIFGARETLKA